jgi:hypothetical protein
VIIGAEEMVPALIGIATTLAAAVAALAPGRGR